MQIFDIGICQGILADGFQRLGQDQLSTLEVTHGIGLQGNQRAGQGESCGILCTGIAIQHGFCNVIHNAIDRLDVGVAFHDQDLAKVLAAKDGCIQGCHASRQRYTTQLCTAVKGRATDIVYIARRNKGCDCGILECAATDLLEHAHFREVDGFQVLAVVECIVADQCNLPRNIDGGQRLTLCKCIHIKGIKGTVLMEGDGGQIFVASKYTVSQICNSRHLQARNGSIAQGIAFNRSHMSILVELNGEATYSQTSQCINTHALQVGRQADLDQIAHSHTLQLITLCGQANHCISHFGQVAAQIVRSRAGTQLQQGLAVMLGIILCIFLKEDFSEAGVVECTIFNLSDFLRHGKGTGSSRRTEQQGVGFAIFIEFVENTINGLKVLGAFFQFDGCQFGIGHEVIYKALNDEALPLLSLVSSGKSCRQRNASQISVVCKDVVAIEVQRLVATEFKGNRCQGAITECVLLNQSNTLRNHDTLQLCSIEGRIADRLQLRTEGNGLQLTGSRGAALSKGKLADFCHLAVGAHGNSSQGSLIKECIGTDVGSTVRYIKYLNLCATKYAHLLIIA